MGGADGNWRRGEQAGAAVFSVLMLAAVLSPLLQYRRSLVERVDGFPLSWYPMFSAKRRRRCWITYAVECGTTVGAVTCRAARLVLVASTRCAGSCTGSR